MLSDEHGVLLVRLDLPAVARMDLLEVDRVEGDLFAKLTINAIQGPSLGPKGRSGIAPKNERDGPLAEMVGESDADPVATASPWIASPQVQRSNEYQVEQHGKA